MRERILVIDDEESVCEILKYNLEKDGYIVDTAYSAEEALEKNLQRYHLFMVDIMMDGMSGFDFAKRLRDIADVENTPIIFCSALNAEDDKVMGLNIGGDDYITKPFSIGEVLARVRAVLRRSTLTIELADELNDYESDIIYEGLRINRNKKIIFLNNEPIKLTRTEYELVEFFLTHRNRIFSRREIISAVWGPDVVVTNRTIDTNITRLRKKLGEYSSYIVTRLGFGYGFTKAD